MQSRDYQGKRENPPYKPSSVIFRHGIQFFRGCYLRNAWAAKATFSKLLSLNGNECNGCVSMRYISLFISLPFFTKTTTFFTKQQHFDAVSQILLGIFCIVLVCLLISLAVIQGLLFIQGTSVSYVNSY